jgi:hypothetical protein
MYSSKDDWCEFCRRYGFTYPSDVYHDGLAVINQSLKGGMLSNIYREFGIRWLTISFRALKKWKAR